ncbi:MAG: hypothetical protein KUG77_17060 [Nannocystaceae bacterium]|nr:hypothetical protein [Nannocystaceae bacterium]
MAGCFEVPNATAGSSAGGMIDTTSGVSVSDSTSGSQSSTGPTTDGSSTSPDPSGSETSVPSTGTQSADSSSDSTSGEVTSMACPIYSDDFEDGVVDPLLIQTNAIWTTEAAGASVITLSPEPDDVFPRVMVDAGPAGLQGATARIEVGTPPQEDGVHLILWVESRETNWRVAFRLAHYGDEILLQARITGESGPGQVLASSEWSPREHRWLQLRESDGTMYFDVSQDGTTFTSLFELPTTFDVSDALIGFVGNNNLPLDGEVEVSVEAFELLCGM